MDLEGWGTPVDSWGKAEVTAVVGDTSLSPEECVGEYGRR